MELVGLSVASPCQLAWLKRCDEGVAFPYVKVHIVHRSFMIFLKIFNL